MAEAVQRYEIKLGEGRTFVRTLTDDDDAAIDLTTATAVTMRGEWADNFVPPPRAIHRYPSVRRRTGNPSVSVAAVIGGTPAEGKVAVDVDTITDLDRDWGLLLVEWKIEFASGPPRIVPVDGYDRLRVFRSVSPP